ncbi:hypothetical protein V5F38_05110 [Xanthobacter sp. V0B-10]|uniref:hypothetical protein n=1 Tax=Xanthobacter albus TaxID=3119929 RepID=UPI0037265D05
MKIQTTKNKVSGVIASLKGLTKQDVLVGIPDENAPRTEAEEEARRGEPINNATIGYINELGSPAGNIPARPHLMPGIDRAKDKIASHLVTGAKGTLSGVADAASIALEKVGLEATSAVKMVITEVIPPPLAERTLADRKARGRTGETPLIDTGQYRNSITYVVRPKGK